MSGKDYKKVDLHMHSTFSDGALEPEELVKQAKQNGVELVALTDHDELAGIEPMRRAAKAAGLDFVTGVEISTEYAGQTIHVVGLGFDEKNEQIASLLEGIREQRKVRAEKMASNLEAMGFKNVWYGVADEVTNLNLISRSHFAGWLYKHGYAKDRQEAFDKYLAPGCPAYVALPKLSVAKAVQIITEAGGVAVLAHPGRYKLEEWKLQALLDEFKKSGGKAIEVTTGSHKPEHVPIFAKIAAEQGFWASTGSDFHFPERKVPIGMQGDLPQGLDPIWMHLPNIEKAN